MSPPRRRGAASRGRIPPSIDPEGARGAARWVPRDHDPDPEPTMASTERFLFIFSYHRDGRTNLWRPGGSTLGRIGPGQPWDGPGVRPSHQSERIVSIDVAVEGDPDPDID